MNNNMQGIKNEIIKAKDTESIEKTINGCKVELAITEMLKEIIRDYYDVSEAREYIAGLEWGACDLSGVIRRLEIERDAADKVNFDETGALSKSEEKVIKSTQKALKKMIKAKDVNQEKIEKQAKVKEVARKAAKKGKFDLKNYVQERYKTLRENCIFPAKAYIAKSENGVITNPEEVADYIGKQIEAYKEEQNEIETTK